MKGLSIYKIFLTPRATENCFFFIFVGNIFKVFATKYYIFLCQVHCIIIPATAKQHFVHFLSSLHSSMKLHAQKTSDKCKRFTFPFALNNHCVFVLSPF